MRHKMVGIVHVATLFDPYKMLGRVEAALAASAGQKLFDRPVILQVNGGRLSSFQTINE